MKLSRLIIISIISVLSGCSITKNVSSAASEIQPGDTVCIEVNPRVTEPDILNVIEQSIIENGFFAEVHTKNPESCELKLTYVAYRKWDFSSFLSKANIKLYKQNRLIGSVEYQTPNGIFGGGGANPAKWGSTESKISPLMAELLKI